MSNFKPSEHLIQIKSKQGEQDYLPVQWRLVWFREQYPQGTIDTDEVCVDLDREEEAEQWVWNSDKRRSEKVVKHGKGYARFKALITTGDGGRATGHKTENAANFGDYYEKAETGAIGRALAALGFGTQFSDSEFAEGERIVDAPVTRQPAATETANEPAALTQSTLDSVEMITAQQISSIRKLCEYIGKQEPKELESMSNLEAKKVIGQLTGEYRQSKKVVSIR